METDLQDYLNDVINDVRNGNEARQLAVDLYTKWMHGLIPSTKQLSSLRGLIKFPLVCGLLQYDGTCKWLRKYARTVGLLPPMSGEKIYCNRRTSGSAAASFEACPGFRKKQDDGSSV